MPSDLTTAMRRHLHGFVSCKQEFGAASPERTYIWPGDHDGARGPPRFLGRAKVVSWLSAVAARRQRAIALLLFNPVSKLFVESISISCGIRANTGQRLDHN